jgi:peptidyl-prolyl cis-trans isomerase D
MMRQMRENTKWIMLITAVAFVLLMVFEWGMDLTGQSSAQMTGGEIGRVNGELVSYEEYMAVYRNIYQQQQDLGPMTVTNRQIEDAAWEQVVMQKLLQRELRDRGIRVTDAEIREAALSAPPQELMSAPQFQTDGQFDLAKYRQFLGSPALDEAFLQQLEAYYRDIIPRSKLFFQTTAGLSVSDGQLWRMYRDANETATVRYIAFDPAALVSDSDVSVSEADVRRYYNENRDDFIRPAQATVRYVVLNRAPSAADSAEALRLAQQYRAAVAGGESFEEVALRATAADEPGRMSGETYTVGRGQSAPALDQVIFSAPIGSVSEPVLTVAGYHIVQVESRDGESARIRQFVVPIELSRASEDRLLDRADSLDRAAISLGLEQAAARLGLNVQTSEITPALPILPDVGQIQEGIEWALEEAEIGGVSDVFESGEAYYMLELIARRDEGVLSLEEASPTVRALLLHRARMERARELLADAERRARRGESLEQIAADYDAQVEVAGPFTRGDFVPGLGRMNAAIGAAFGLAEGHVSPIVEAENHLFLLQGVERTLASREAWEAQMQEQRARVLQSLADTRWNQFMTALRESAEVVDNRRQVLRNASSTGL